MRFGEGVEWAVHACALLAVAPADRGLSAKALAEFHDLPPAYLAKHLQALARAGLLTTSRGPRGGYRLARPAGEISLWEVAEAIEGSGAAFRCTEIRQRGPCAASAKACIRPCGIAAAFGAAEKALRNVLEKTTIADAALQAAAAADSKQLSAFRAWLVRAAT